MSTQPVRLGSCRIAAAAIQAAEPFGMVRAYFVREAAWEAQLRRGFRECRKRLRDSGWPPHNEAKTSLQESLKTLNARYGTRATEDDRRYVGYAVLKVVQETGWWAGEAPKLLVPTTEEQELRKVAEVVTKALKQSVSKGAKKRHYSLMTKCLHFLFPLTFAIYDQKSALSIQTWGSWVCAEARKQGTPHSQSFALRQMEVTTGEGYTDILRFYRVLWAQLRPEDIQRLEQVASLLTAVVRKEPGGDAASVTTIDVLDKLLWHAAGHAELLGLRME